MGRPTRCRNWASLAGTSIRMATVRWGRAESIHQTERLADRRSPVHRAEPSSLSRLIFLFVDLTVATEDAFATSTAWTSSLERREWVSFLPEGKVREWERTRPFSTS